MSNIGKTLVEVPVGDGVHVKTAGVIEEARIKWGS
jgi:hypothetical protein